MTIYHTRPEAPVNPWDWLRAMNSSRSVEFLLTRAADVHCGGMPWATPLAWAVKKGHEEVADRLRAAGAEM